MSRQCNRQDHSTTKRAPLKGTQQMVKHFDKYFVEVPSRVSGVDSSILLSSY